jgi:adenylate cyclase
MSLGDGLMFSFSGPLEAVGCAVAMQRAVAGHNQAQPERSLGVRVGLHAGEPLAAEGDYLGMAVHVANRLCDRGEGGQILASELVALVCSRGGFCFRPAGRLSLKGVPNPVAAVVVDCAEPAVGPAPAVPSAAGPLPRPQAAPAAVRGPRLVGRDRPKRE